MVQHRGELATASVFLWIAAGIALLVSVHSAGAALVGLVLLGMGNGMTTLARATAIAERRVARST